MDGERRTQRAGASTPLAVALALAAAGAGLAVARSPGDAQPGAFVHGRVTLGAEGRVTFAGTPPAGSPIDMSADAYCREQHGEPVVDRPVRVGPDGGVANVLVYVRNAPSGGPSTGDAEAILDQSGCMYAPVVVAVRVGQTLVIRNSDQTLHNVRVAAQVNRAFNVGQPLKGIESHRSFERGEIGIPVRCDIHGWMHSTIHVLAHGFFAVSHEDGRFALPELPPGEYVIEAWHATLGTAERTVTVTGGSRVEIAFEFGG